MASGDIGKNKRSSDVQKAFAEMTHDDPLFMELKQLLLHGKRAEAIKLVQSNLKFETPEAQELTQMIMGTLRDTMIDP